MGAVENAFWAFSEERVEAFLASTAPAASTGRSRCQRRGGHSRSGSMAKKRSPQNGGRSCWPCGVVRLNGRLPDGLAWAWAPCNVRSSARGTNGWTVLPGQIVRIGRIGVGAPPRTWKRTSWNCDRT